MIETLEKIEDLLKAENFKFVYDYYIVENTLYLSLDKEVKKNSLYHYDYLYNDDNLCEETKAYSSWEYEQFNKHKIKNKLWSCVEIGGEQKEKYKNFRVEVYNNIDIHFTTAKNDNHRKHYIKNDSYIVEFVELYVIPAMHSIETCTELLAENYHFTHKKTEDNFSDKLLIEARKRKIKNII